MPRKARKKSSLCINHVILRGVNQQIIFEDEYDYQQFMEYPMKMRWKSFRRKLTVNHQQIFNVWDSLKEIST